MKAICWYGGEDYEVSLSNVENAGKADIIITGIGHYYCCLHDIEHIICSLSEYVVCA